MKIIIIIIIIIIKQEKLRKLYYCCFVRYYSIRHDQTKFVFYPFVHLSVRAIQIYMYCQILGSSTRWVAITGLI